MVNKCSAGKENVPLALEVMHETTITAAWKLFFKSRRCCQFFRNVKHLMDYFELSEKIFAKYTGNAVINGEKMLFLRSLTD